MRFLSLHLCQNLNQEQAPNSNNSLMGKTVLCDGQLFRNAPSEKLDCLVSCTLVLPPLPSPGYLSGPPGKKWHSRKT